MAKCKMSSGKIQKLTGDYPHVHFFDTKPECSVTSWSLIMGMSHQTNQTNQASAEATRMSHAWWLHVRTTPKLLDQVHGQHTAIRSTPPPTQAPCTQAMTGTGEFETELMASCI
jgi:hypothetical protein